MTYVENEQAEKLNLEQMEKTMGTVYKLIDPVQRSRITNFFSSKTKNVT